MTMPERIDFGGEPVVFNPKKRKSRRKGFDPLRVFSGPMFEQRMTSAELAMMPQLARDQEETKGREPLPGELGAAPRPKGAK